MPLRSLLISLQSSIARIYEESLQNWCRILLVKAHHLALPRPSWKGAEAETSADTPLPKSLWFISCDIHRLRPPEKGPVTMKKAQISEQLPCRSVEVKFFSVFLCQRCCEIWCEILVKFSVLRFPGIGCARENSPTFHVMWKTENFTQISLCWGAALTDTMKIASTAFRTTALGNCRLWCPAAIAITRVWENRAISARSGQGSLWLTLISILPCCLVQ